MLRQIETSELTAWFPQAEAVQDDRRARELDLVRRVQSGDQAAFRDLVERYQAKIFSVIHRMLRNHEDAEDTAQRVFTKVYFAIQRFDCRSSLLTWIYKIAVNECYTHFRQRRAQLEYETPAPELEAIASHKGAHPPADTMFATRDYVGKLLRRIPEEDRLLLVLKEVEGHSIGELAEMTGSSESAIKTKLFRARHKLIEAAARLSRRPAVEAAC
jgi:RNA polymerase sigma-70 factor (ECF subfamily)